MEVQVLLQSSSLPLPAHGTLNVGPDWRLRQFLSPGVKGRKSLGQVAAALSIRQFSPRCSLPCGEDTRPYSSCLSLCRGGGFWGWGKRGAEGVVWLLKAGTSYS